MPATSWQTVHRMLDQVVPALKNSLLRLWDNYPPNRLTDPLIPDVGGRCRLVGSTATVQRRLMNLVDRLMVCQCRWGRIPCLLLVPVVVGDHRYSSCHCQRFNTPCALLRIRLLARISLCRPMVVGPVAAVLLVVGVGSDRRRDQGLVPIWDDRHSMLRHLRLICIPSSNNNSSNNTNSSNTRILEGIIHRTRVVITLQARLRILVHHGSMHIPKLRRDDQALRLSAVLRCHYRFDHHHLLDLLASKKREKRIHHSLPQPAIPTM